MDRTAVLGVTLTATTAAAGMFDRVLPRVAEVRERPVSPAATAQIRRQCARTAAVVVAGGIGVSALVRSLWPVAAVLGVVGWMWLEYEAAAATPGGHEAGAVVDQVAPSRPVTAAPFGGAYG